MSSGQVDWVIIALAAVLCGFGLAIIGSVAPNLVFIQALSYFVGFILLFLFSNIDFRLYQGFGKLLYVLSLILLSVTLVIGLESRGAVRWVSLGPLRLQFSEILKPFLVTALAGLLVSKSRWYIPLALVPVILVFKQPDLGSALVYFAAFLAMFFVSGVNLGVFLIGGGVSIVILPVIWYFLAAYQRLRVLSFLSPRYDPLGSNYNAIQAVITVGSGMLTGLGLGHGTQSHLLFLPERQTDFIFASVGEEFGFVGSAIILVVYFVLIYRIFRVAGRSEDQFIRIVVCGLGVILLVQVAVNVGMNLGLLPVTGITLPLISYGGSSVLATFIALGMVEMAARVV